MKTIFKLIGFYIIICFISAVTVFPAQSTEENLRIGPTAWSFKEYTFFEAIEKTSTLGMRFIEAFQGQKISPDSDQVMDYTLPDVVLDRIKQKLNEHKLVLTSIYIHKIPGEENACRKVFEFCKKLHLETIVSEPDPKDLDTIDKLCGEFDINVAIHNHAKGLSLYWHPNEILKVCQGRSQRIGACGDTGHWQRSGINPVDAVKTLKDRLLSLHLKDLNEMSMEGHDVPWGTGKGDIANVLRELVEQKAHPTLIGIEYEYNWKNSMPEIAQCDKFYEQTLKALHEKPLYVGWASVDITPAKPVALVGQLNKRISQKVLDPLTATALALETRDENGVREQSIMVSCDVLFIRKAIQERLRDRVKNSIPDFNGNKLFLNATHTHTAPGFSDDEFKGLYDISKDEGVMKPSEYADFFVERVTQVITQAWQNRKPGGMSWGLGHAVIGLNRRAHYFDGKSIMYGDTARPDFSNMEGYEDHSVGMIFFWTADKQLTGILMNVACTSQETEGLSDVSADFWHDTRLEIRKRLSNDGLFIFPQCSTAGDQSPHVQINKKAEEIMRERRGLSGRQEIARRLADAVDDVLPLSKDEIANRVIFKHKVARVAIPVHEPLVEPFYVTDTVDPIEFHVMRLGDIAIATNPFELYLDYGIRIKVKSPAVFTFLSQLSCQLGGYLPTEKGVQGGGYSADKFIVGPKGGQVLVDETVNQLNILWK